MKSTLVIAGDGYIGPHQMPHLVPHLVRQLVAKGRKVTVLGRSTAPWYESLGGVDYVTEDFSKNEIICRLLDTHQEIIHLAYAAVPDASPENSHEDLLKNLPATLQLFSEVAVRGGRLVFISSGSGVYGEAVELPIRETHPTKPISAYGVTKLTLENYARLYGVTHGLKFICVRPSNVYGDGQRPFEGQGFIATAIASVLRGMPIKIFGSNDIIRDYIYVSDLASGIVSALECGRVSETYNIGTGVGLSNLDVIESITPLMQEIGCEVRIESFPARSFDVKTNVLDSIKLQTETDWRTKVGFIDGIVATRDWLKTQHK